MNENLSDVDRQLNDYLSGKSGRMPNLTGDDRSEALKGAVAGYHQLRGLGYGVTGLLGDVTRWEGLKKWGVEGYQSAMEDASKYQASVPDITRARSAGEVADWMLYYIPNAMVSTLPTIVAGGVPGLVAKAGGKKFVEKAATELVKQGINKTAAKELAQAQLAKRVQKQMLGTTMATGVGMSAGGIYGDTGDAGVALSHGAVAGAIDALPVMSWLKKAGLGQVAREGIGDSVGKAMAKGALEEAGTEGLQSFIEQHASHWVASNGESLLQNMDAVDWREMINSSLAGAGAGGTFSGMAGIPNAMENRRMNKASDEELTGTVDGFNKRIEQVVQAKNEAIARGHDTKILNEQIDNLKLQRDKVNQILANRNQGGLNLGEAVDITGQAPAEDIVPAPVGTQGVSGRQPVNLGAALDISSPYNPSIAGAAQEAMQAEAAKGGDALTQAIAGSRAAGVAQEANADRLIQGQSGYQATGLQQPSMAYGDQQLENAKAQVQQQIADLNEQFETGAIDFDQYADMTMDLDSMSRLLDQQGKGAAPAIPDMTQPQGLPAGTPRGAYGTGLGTVPQGTAMEETLRASTGTGLKGLMTRKRIAEAEPWIPPVLEGLPEDRNRGVAVPQEEVAVTESAPVTPPAQAPKPTRPEPQFSLTRTMERVRQERQDMVRNLEAHLAESQRTAQEAQQREEDWRLAEIQKAEQDIINSLKAATPPNQAMAQALGKAKERKEVGEQIRKLQVLVDEDRKQREQELAQQRQAIWQDYDKAERQRMANDLVAEARERNLFTSVMGERVAQAYADRGEIPPGLEQLVTGAKTEDIERLHATQEKLERNKALQKILNNWQAEQPEIGRIPQPTVTGEATGELTLPKKPPEEPPKKPKQETLPEDTYDYVPNSEGDIDLGHIDKEQAKAIHSTDAPIRIIKGWHKKGGGGVGLVHIQNDARSQQIKKAGYDTEMAFIEDIAKNYNQIYQGSGDSYILAKVNGQDKVSYIRLIKNLGDDYYGVGSAHIARKNFLKNKELLWERAHLVQSERSPSALSGSDEQSPYRADHVNPPDFSGHSSKPESTTEPAAAELTGKPTEDQTLKQAIQNESASFSETFVVPGDIGGVPSLGEILGTATNRKTTPFPKWDTSTPRKARNSEKKINEWLMDNAIEEARSRGDDFNLRQFEANRDKPTVADRESANEYLFGEQQPQTVRPALKPLVEPATTRPGLEKMVAAKQEKEKNQVAARQEGHDRMAEQLRESARKFTGHSDGKSLTPLAIDIAEFTIKNKRRVEDADRKTLADKHGVSEDVVRSMEGQQFTYDRVLYESQKLNNKDAEDFLMMNVVKNLEAEGEPERATQQAAPSARQQRQVKRKRKLVEVDAELSAAFDEVANIFNKHGGPGRLGSGVDPTIVAELLVVGGKASALLLKKGAIKFADWADNVLAIMESKGVAPETMAPYLKKMYLSAKDDVDDTTFDQMDDSRTVRAFDVNSLIEPEEVSADQVRQSEDAVIDEVINPKGDNEKGWLERQIFGNPDKQNSRLAIRHHIDGALRRLRHQGDLETYKAFIEHGDRKRVTDAVMAERERRLNAAEPTPQPEAKTRPTADPATRLKTLKDLMKSFKDRGFSFADFMDDYFVGHGMEAQFNPYNYDHRIHIEELAKDGQAILGTDKASDALSLLWKEATGETTTGKPAEPEPAGQPLTGQSISQTGKDMLPASIQAQKEKASRIANKQKKLKTLAEKADNERKEKEAREQLRQMRLKVFAAEDAIDKVIETDDLSHFDEYAELFPKVRNYLKAVVLQAEGQPLTQTGATGSIGKYTVTPLSEKAFLVSGTDPDEKDIFGKNGLGGLWRRNDTAWMYQESRREEIIAALQERTGETVTMPATETETGKKHETTERTGIGVLGGISTGQVPEVQGGGQAGEGGRDHTGEGQQAVAGTDRHGGTEPELPGGATHSVPGTDIHGAGGVSESDVGRGGRNGGLGGGIPTGGRGRGGEGRGGLGTTREGGINTGAADYTIDNHADLEGKTFRQTEKFNNNIEAIRLLKALGDRPATAEQQKILSRYVGWGGLKQAFYRPDGSTAKGWEKRAAELKELLTPEEYRAAEDSIKNAHYTSPSVVLPIYDALDNIGFRHGRILEPSVGVGNFLGLMPANMRQQSAIVGVELDHITSGIAGKLYPTARIHKSTDFRDFDIAENSYDLIVGNPPFGEETLTDLKRKDISGMRIHNYFLLKSLKALRPGGVMAVVVSKGFMDSTFNQKGRNMMFRDAKLLGAFRLPNEAFKANANTDVTTDILFFQKREEPWLDEPDPSENLYRERATFTGADGSTMKINEYFVSNPDNMLGDMIMNDGRYGEDLEPALAARPGLDWKAELEKRARQLVNEPVYQPRKNPVPASIVVQADSSQDINNAEIGGLYLNDKGELWRRRPDVEGEQQGEPVTGYENDKSKFIEFRPNQVEKIKAALQLARTARRLINLQVTDMTDPELEPLRQQMNREYDAFVKQYKALNRPDNKRILNEADITVAPMLFALEGRYKKEKRIAGKVVRKESATKADIFTRRTQQPHRPVTKVDNSEEGLIVSLAETGRVDIDRIVELTGHDKLKVVADLEGRIFNDPLSGWQTRDEYLSGNVKLKLRQAKEAGRGFEENVKALEAVQPKDIPANEIVTAMGASWQTPEVIQDFYNHLGGGESVAGFEPVRNFWTFRDTGQGRNTNEAKRWSTPDMSLKDLFTAVLNNRPIAVRIRHDDGTSTLDVKATDVAQVKAREIANEFSTWLWRDPQRREAMSRRYNDLINTNVNRQFDGSFLSFPGKISDDIIKLRRTQANAVWRILQSKSTLLDHVVGAGKTFTVIAATMEMRRMNIARKPMIVVPNHLVAQWAEDFYRLYPNAKVLAATKKDFATGRRQELFSRIATGDWDAVIVAHSSFGKIPNDPQAEQDFINQQLNDLNTAIETLREMEGKDTRSVRDAVNQRKKLEEKLKKLLENTGKDTGINWKETGVDAMFVDEAHEFKNLEFFTSMNRVKNINPQGSDKAMNLYIKIRSLMEKTGGRNVVFATGTPISNSMAELYTMQRYLAYDQLTDSGLSHFDAWARTFGEIDTRQERKPSGKFGPVSRFSKFVNLPELMRMYRMFADKISNTDIIAALKEEGKGKHIPKIKGGRPQPVVAPRSLYQEAYMSLIESRFENMPDDPRVDNPLKATNDARKAGLDMRMIYPDLPDFPDSKINKAVDNMMRLYHDWEADKGTQLVFCDLSTPKSSKAKEIAGFRKLVEEAAADDDSDRRRQVKTMTVSDLYDYLQDMADSGNKKAITRLQKVSPDDVAALETDFDVYNDIKEKLIGRGVPAEEIAFIHSYNTDLQKEELFSKVNNGEIRFLLGSTAKMGAGTNVQERLVGLHHMDAPWRPSDLEQREGRIIRQGNSLFSRDPEGFEVEILRYASEMTYDVNMWQTLEVKARFIEQIRNGDTDQRTADDVAGESASAAEMKAASSGDPRIMELVDIQARLRVLDSLRQTHRYEANTAVMQLDKYRDEIDYLPGYIKSLQEDQDRIQPLREDAKGKVIPDLAGLDGKKFKTRKAGEDYLKKTILAAAKDRNHKLWQGAKIGTYRGFDVVAQLEEFSAGDLLTATEVSMYLTGNRDYEIFRSDVEKTGWTNVVNRFDRFLDGDETRYPYLESQVAQQHQRLRNAKADLAGAEERSNAKFKYEDEYQQKTARNQQLMDELGSEREVNPAAEALPEYWALVSKSEDYADVTDMPIHKELENIAYQSRIKRLIDSVLYSKPGYEQKAADAALKKAKEQGITIRPADIEAAKTAAEAARQRQQEAETTIETPATAGVSGSGVLETDIPAYLQPQTLGFGEDMPVSTGKARMGRQAVEATIRGFKRKYPGLANLNIRVLKDTTELPQLYRRGEPLENRANQGAAFIPGNNTVYIFADNVHSPADIITILQHETFAHFAIDSLPEAERQAFVDQIHAAVQSDPELRKIWQEVSKTYEGYSRRTQAEEVVARIAEDNPEAMGALRRLWWQIRKLYRQYFDGALPLKHWEVAGFVSEFARRVETGTYRPSASESRNYGALPEGTLVGAPAYFRRNKDGSASFTIKGASDQAGRFFNGQSFAENDVLKKVKRSGLTAREGVRKMLLPALGGRQITDLYAKYVEPLAQKTTEDGTTQFLGNPLENYQRHLQNMQALANNKAHEANDIDIEWGRLATENPVDYESVSDLMHQTTIYEVKPYEAFTPFADMDKLETKRDLIQDELNAGHDVDDAEDVKRYEDLKDQYQRITKKIEFEQDRDRLAPQLIEQYNKLGDKAKAIYKDVEKYYQDMWQETHDALVNNVERNVREGNDRKAFLDFLKTMFASNQVRGPYFPLRREGDYFIIAEDENGEYYREHLETLGAMDARKEELQNEGFTIFKSGKLTEFNAQDAAGVSEFAGKLYDSMNGPAFADIPPDVRFRMQEEINQAVLQMLPDVSAAKSQIRRKKIKGYSQNARRSFAFTAIHSANRLARITYADQMLSEIKRIEDDIDSHNTEGVIPDKDQPIASAVVDEMKKRHETIVNPNGSPLTAHITNAAFIWYLGASAGAGLVNMTQTPLIALPLLGSRFGFRKSGKAFMKATADYAKYSKKRLTLRKSMMTLSEAESGISADEKAMIDELVRDGTIETTQAHTLSGIADTDVKPNMQKHRERWDKVMRITGVFFHNAEVANREVTALAAYRLARDSGQNHQAALETARKTVFDSHFDYSGANRPRVMKNNWIKVFTIFRQYSQNMTYLLTSNLATMMTLSKTPKADRIAAFKALAGILFGHALMAGTLGLPLVSVIGSALAAALGDEDDEFRDWETMYRNWLADLFGKETGHAIAKGVFNGFMGRDLHSRTSLNDLWIRSPNYEMSAREESMHYLMQALGPAVGAGINFFLGLEQVAQGQTLKGIEKMVPKFIRDGIRTYRYGTEGATVGREGYQAMIEDFSASEVFWQAMGISPARLSEAYGARSSVMNMEKRIKKAKGDLLRDYYRAYRESDYDAMRRVMGEIQQFNQANPMFRIKNLAQSIRTRNRYQQMSESGIYLPYQQKGLLSEARYAM